jgi:hypothetical protein
MNDLIKNVSNDELYKMLKLRRIHVGPVVKSTRSLYEKRLLNHLNQNIFPGKTLEYIISSTFVHSKPFFFKETVHILTSDEDDEGYESILKEKRISQIGEEFKKKSKDNRDLKIFLIFLTKKYFFF